MKQTWRDLLFLHWAVDPDAVARTLPRGLAVDTFDGRAWVGIVPLFMRDVRAPLLPSVGPLSNFHELNLRTYAYDEAATPGVWFYSLDADQWLAVETASRVFRLPYRHAAMQSSVAGEEISFTSLRRGEPPSHRASFRWRGRGGAGLAEPGTLEFFLVERYVMFARPYRDGTVPSARVHHEPYRIETADVLEWSAVPFGLEGLERPARAPDHVLVARAVEDVDVFALEGERAIEPAGRGRSG
jgi:uncharacterized protein YqjF (DUF2071 family)